MALAPAAHQPDCRRIGPSPVSAAAGAVPTIGGHMPLASFETPLESTTTRAFHDGPILECAPPATSPGQDAADPTLRIRAHRVYAASREELFASWTRRTAWDSWMRLRSRSRSTLSPFRGGAFRLELAEGPAIHVIA